MSSWVKLRLLRDTWEMSGSVSVCQWLVRAARGHFKAVRTIMCQYDYAFMCLRTLFCFINISAPWYRTELVLYSKFADGSQFSGQKYRKAALHGDYVYSYVLPICTLHPRITLALFHHNLTVPWTTLNPSVPLTLNPSLLCTILNPSVPYVISTYLYFASL